MFFKRKYNYDKYIKDIENLMYNKEELMILYDFPTNDDDKSSFIMTHLGLLNSHILKYLMRFPFQITKIDEITHTEKIAQIFIKNIIILGLFENNKKDREEAKKLFLDSIQMWDDEEISPERIHFLAGDIANEFKISLLLKASYINLMQSHVLFNLKCVTKLLESQKTIKHE